MKQASWALVSLQENTRLATKILLQYIVLVDLQLFGRAFTAYPIFPANPYVFFIILILIFFTRNNHLLSS
jgi:hypothetical protein